MQNSPKSRLVNFVMAVAVALATASCFDIGPRSFTFIIAIDTIKVKDTVAVGDSLFVNLVGRIAYDGCGQFKELRKTRSGGMLEYTAIGDHDDRRICLEGLIIFNRTDTVLPPQVNPTTIKVIQPKGVPTKMRNVVVLP